VVQVEMLFCSTVVGLPFLIPPMVFTGELVKAWNSCFEVSFPSIHPKHMRLADPVIGKDSLTNISNALFSLLSVFSPFFLTNKIAFLTT
jgi:hypothetical protein